MALAAWMVVILFNSSVAGAPLPTPDLLSTLLSKAGHVLEYSLLGWLAWRALVSRDGGVALPAAPSAVLIIAGGALFAGLDELRQLFVTGRGVSGWDVLIDTMALSAAVAYQLRSTSLKPGQGGGEPSKNEAGEDG